MKRLLFSLLVLCVAITPVFAGNLGFVYDGMDLHPEILSGLVPTLLRVGVDYQGLELIEGQSTDVKFILGGGYINRETWLNDDMTAYLLDQPEILDSMSYNVVDVEWKILFEQGLLWSDVADTDLITLYAGYEGRYETAFEDGTAPSTFLNGSAAYPDGSELLSNTLVAGFTVNLLDDRMVYAKGLEADVSMRYAPGFLLNNLDSFSGSVDFWTANASIIGAYTFYQMKDDYDRNLFSVTLADRVMADYTKGTEIPVYALLPASLGDKMRGFPRLTYMNQFSVVNNFDVRFAGPELLINGIFPRLNLYADMGYFSGPVANASFEDSGFLASAGAEATLSFFDFLNLGYRINYVLAGNPFTGNNFSTNIMIGLKF